MAQDDFVVKLPVGMEIDDDAAKDLSKQIDEVSSKLPELKIKVKSDAAKDITREIDHLVESLRKSGRTDFKVNLLGDDGADIRKVSIEYAELADGIKKVIQQEYNLKDIRAKGVLLGQEWTEGSKAVVKYTQGVDEAKAKTEANKKAMSELAAEIASVNKNLSKSEVEFARGNQNTSNLYFSEAADKELQAQQKILALEKEGVITTEQGVQALVRLDEAIASASREADVFNAKLADESVRRELAEREKALNRYADLFARIELEERKQQEANAKEADRYVSKEVLSDIEEYVRLLKEVNATESHGDMDKPGASRFDLLQREAALHQKINNYREEGFLTQISAEALEREFADRVEATAKEMEQLNNQSKMRNASDYFSNEDVRAYIGMLEEVEAKEKEIANLSSEMTGWLDSDSRLKESPYFSSEINKLVEGLKKGDITADEARKSLAKLKSEAKAAGLAGKTMGSQIVDALKDIANIATVTEVVYTLYNATRKVIGNIHELDDVMVDLQIASGASADEVERLMDDYHNLAKELGATSVEVAQAADGWLRQGYSAAESAELIRNSTMLAKLGQMEAAEATNALTSAMKGYKYSVEEAESIVDKFAAVDMSAAVSAGYLATAMAQTAVGANKMGIDFDTLTGYIATVGEVTQQSAESVGNFFKTLVARMGNIKAGNLYDPESAESLSDVETVLKGAGIALRDSQDEFRNFKLVLDEVADKWQTYSSVQQKAIAVAFSG